MTQVRYDHTDDSPRLFVFDELFQQYSGLIYNLAYRFAQNPSDADDISQEVWLKVHQKLETLHSPKAFSSWLWRTASNVCIDHHRRLRRLQPLDETVPSSEDVEGEVVSGRESQLAWQALSSLPEKQKLMLYLREVEELDYKQIAAAIGCSVGAVAMGLFRARRELATAYQILDASPAAQCSQSVKLMSLLLDQQGDEVSRRALRAHLETCLTCEVAFNQAKRGSRLYGAIPMLPAVAIRQVFAPHFAAQASVFAGLVPHLQQAAIPIVASAALLLATVGPSQTTGEPRPTEGGFIQPLPVQQAQPAPLIAASYEPRMMISPREDTFDATRSTALDRFGYPVSEASTASGVVLGTVLLPSPASLPPDAGSVNNAAAVLGQLEPVPEVGLLDPPAAHGLIPPTEPGSTLTTALALPPVAPLVQPVNDIVTGLVSALPLPLSVPPALEVPQIRLPPVAPPLVNLPAITLPPVHLPPVSLPSTVPVTVPSVTARPTIPSTSPPVTGPSLPSLTIPNVAVPLVQGNALGTLSTIPAPTPPNLNASVPPVSIPLPVAQQLPKPQPNTPLVPVIRLR
jgi:RNA polymerase sigma-70 factor, ECF subfamily